MATNSITVSSSLTSAQDDNEIFSGGILNVTGAGVATITLIDSGGSMTVSNGGQDGGPTTISSGGFEIVGTNGVATNATIQAGGTFTAIDNAALTALVVSS